MSSSSRTRFITSLLLIVLPLACAAARGQPAASEAGAHASAARCRSPHATVDVCDDAIRWNPRDSSLLVSMGDAQMRARRPADAARAYRRAAALAPGTPGLQQKIANADASFAKAKKGASSHTAAAAKHFSNADPDSQSH